MKKNDAIQSLKAARRVATPLLAISTSDQFDLSDRIFESVGNGEVPKVLWDCVRGPVGKNRAGADAISAMGITDPQMMAEPVSMLVAAAKLPPLGILVMLNAHRFLEATAFLQAIYNLRDQYTEGGQTLVLLGTSFRLPAELGDVVVLDDPLPSDEQVGEILDRLYRQNLDGAVPEKDARSGAVDAARGLSAFAAEQVFAMSLTKEGVDLDSAWERKRAQVNQTPGLKFSFGETKLEDLGGLESIREFAKRVATGRKPPGAYVFIDEVEKAFAGAQSDTSGVSQDYLGSMLSWMEDRGYSGIIAVGPPGSGKTAFAQAVGGSYGRPTISLDLGGLKEQFVGASERNLREAQKVIDSIAGDAAYFVATCNLMDSLPAPLVRRFKGGTWFFDLPTEEERQAILKIHLTRHGFIGSEDACVNVPNLEGWTGAEIRNMVEMAWQLGCSLKEAAQYVIPVSRANPQAIESLRAAARGKWLSASHAGPYRGVDDAEQQGQQRKGRTVQMTR